MEGLNSRPASSDVDKQDQSPTLTSWVLFPWGLTVMVTILLQLL